MRREPLSVAQSGAGEASQLQHVALQMVFVVVAVAVLLDVVDLEQAGAFDQSQVPVGLVSIEAADVAPHLIQGLRIAKEPEHFQPALLEAALTLGRLVPRVFGAGGTPGVGRVLVLVAFTEDRLRRRERLHPCEDTDILNLT